MVSPDQSRQEFKKGGVSTPPGPDMVVRTEKYPVGSVTTHHGCPWGKQYQDICLAGIYIA